MHDDKKEKYCKITLVERSIDLLMLEHQNSFKTFIFVIKAVNIFSPLR